tara:strand:+ start:490 stop:1446 length:957 start_codon:yes stop_codon:yes gene_type:complete
MVNKTDTPKTASTMNDAVVPAYERILAFAVGAAKTLTIKGARIDAEQGTIMRTYAEDSNTYTRKQVEAFVSNLYSRVRTMHEEQRISVPVQATVPDGDTVVVVIAAVAKNWMNERTHSVMNGAPLPAEAENMNDIVSVLVEPYSKAKPDKKQCAGAGLSRLKKDNRAAGDRRKAMATNLSIVAGNGFDSMLRTDGAFKNQKQAINKTAMALATLNGFTGDWDAIKATYEVEAAQYIFAVDGNGNSANGPVSKVDKENAIKQYAAEEADTVVIEEQQAAPEQTLAPDAAMPAFNAELFATLMASGVDPTVAANIAGGNA